MAYQPLNPNGATSSANSSPVVIATDQDPIQIGNGGTSDTFGVLRTSSSHNDIDIQFFRDDPNNILTVTPVGGTVVQLTGYAQFSTSAAATGSIKGVSTDKTHYHSGGEIYVLFTAAWLSGGQSTSFQRIGLYDTTSGIFIGYENTTFGVTIRTGGLDTQTGKAAFNIDTLTGAATSKFTRNGSPESINLALSNVFRIRFGWLGSAPIKFEVMSPDGDWVLFHVVRYPNTASTPSIHNPDLPMTCELTKTAGATNIQLNTNCWSAGIQYESQDWTESSTLSSVLNSTIDYNINSLGSCSLYILTGTTGTIAFEATIDGKNYFIHPGVIDQNSGGTDLLVEGTVIPTTGNYYRVPLTGYKGFRIRTATTLGANITVYFVGVENNLYLPSFGTAPHNVGYQPVHKDAVYTTAQTSTSFWVTTTGKKFVITDLTITTGGNVAGIVTMYDAPSGVAYVAGSSPAIFRGEFSPSTTSRPGVVKNFIFPYVSATASHNVLVTTSAAINPIYIQVNGYEI